MAKTVIKFICQQCGYESPSWLGKCPNCEEWNSLVETVVSTKVRGSRFEVREKERKTSQPLKLSAIKKTQLRRILTGIGEFDRVLGNGLVPGSVILLAGEPGIGKSTLLLQVADEISKACIPHFRDGVRPKLSSQVNDKSSLTLRKTAQTLIVKKKVGSSGFSEHSEMGITRLTKTTSVLYVSGEESAEQLKLRAQRLGIKGKNLLILEETNVEGITDVIRKWEVGSGKWDTEMGSENSGSENSKIQRFKDSKSKKSHLSHLTSNSSLIIIDSIQTLYSQELTGSPGSIGQVRYCTAKLFDIAKRTRTPMIFIGHITKGGTIAGPKTIEHLVDTVLYLEGERTTSLRILRSFKNRFGPTDEVGVFQMEEGGLEEVSNPSQFFLEERQKKAPGSVITIALQGTRPILAEAESLVVPTKLAFPRRVASGIAFSRLQIICAILQKRLRMPLGGFDVYVSISGGLKITEPAADLAIALSIISSYKNKVLTSNTAVVGELGLLGEIRKVPLLEKRIKEARRLGYGNVLSSNRYRDLVSLLKSLQLA
ncbi:MAG: DNA repair protein RadA [Bacteroidetes bacterium]|nr:DNA repair protein RadA [Bacteroidota bacterium]MBL7159090.1 DNA repair protein RadA [Candidatus Microgenomates bacterium]